MSHEITNKLIEDTVNVCHRVGLTTKRRTPRTNGLTACCNAEKQVHHAPKNVPNNVRRDENIQPQANENE